MTIKRVFGLALLGLTLAGGVPAAHAVTTVGQTAMPGMSPTDAGAGAGSSMTSGRVVTIGAGAVVGYVLMLNPYGAAIMGAAMGGMLVDWIYYGSSTPATPPVR
jgi:hypothetical protein